MELTFVETTAFTRRIRDQGLEEDLRELQSELLRNPEKGALDPEQATLTAEQKKQLRSVAEAFKRER